MLSPMLVNTAVRTLDKQRVPGDHTRRQVPSRRRGANAGHSFVVGGDERKGEARHGTPQIDHRNVEGEKRSGHVAVVDACDGAVSAPIPQPDQRRIVQAMRLEVSVPAAPLAVVTSNTSQQSSAVCARGLNQNRHVTHVHIISCPSPLCEASIHNSAIGLDNCAIAGYWRVNACPATMRLMQSTPVGMIGLGLMGTAMTERLLDAGYEVHVWNRTREKASPLLALGARGRTTRWPPASGRSSAFTQPTPSRRFLAR
jgi:hypothetical protein